MKAGVVVFPGSNCDHDTYHALKHAVQFETRFLWHKDRSFGNLDLIVLPGGFSYGDYLRSGAIARFSPIMESVREFAVGGGLVLGICNGFQILQEAGLLPGAMLRNRGLKFVCRPVHVRVERADTPFTNALAESHVLEIPIAHNEGNFFAAPDVLEELEQKGQVVLRYCSPAGRLDDDWNPNGSTLHVAGVINEAGNVMGLMPHPERASEACLGLQDGKKIFDSLKLWCERSDA